MKTLQTDKALRCDTPDCYLWTGGTYATASIPDPDVMRAACNARGIEMGPVFVKNMGTGSLTLNGKFFAAASATQVVLAVGEAVAFIPGTSRWGTLRGAA